MVLVNDGADLNENYILFFNFNFLTNIIFDNYLYYNLDVCKYYMAYYNFIYI